MKQKVILKLKGEKRREYFGDAFQLAHYDDGTITLKQRVMDWEAVITFNKECFEYIVWPEIKNI